MGKGGRGARRKGEVGGRGGKANTHKGCSAQLRAIAHLKTSGQLRMQKQSCKWRGTRHSHPHLYKYPFRGTEEIVKMKKKRLLR
jgi:hypothetical protein